MVTESSDEITHVHHEYILSLVHFPTSSSSHIAHRLLFVSNNNNNNEDGASVGYCTALHCNTHDDNDSRCTRWASPLNLFDMTDQAK